MDRGDVKFFLGRDDTPEVKACLMCPTEKSVYNYKMDTSVTSNYAGVYYGLCIKCDDLIRKDLSYFTKVMNEIDSRMNELETKGESNE